MAGASTNGSDGSADHLAVFRAIAQQYPDAVVIHLAPHPHRPVLIVTTWTADGARVTRPLRMT